MAFDQNNFSLNHC